LRLNFLKLNSLNNFSYKEDEIERKVAKFRKQLQEKDAQKDENEVELAYDEYGRPT
jgi:hypothetical protein